MYFYSVLLKYYQNLPQSNFGNFHPISVYICGANNIKVHLYLCFKIWLTKNVLPPSGTITS